MSTFIWLSMLICFVLTYASCLYFNKISDPYYHMEKSVAVMIVLVSLIPLLNLYTTFSVVCTFIWHRFGQNILNNFKNSDSFMGFK